MPQEIYDVFAARYNILDSIETKEFDMDFDKLRQFFSRSRKQIYSPRDRYIIVHQDTDVYIKEMSVGLNLRNCLVVAEELDIPFYTIILWTNHFGLQREIDLLCEQRDVQDRPTVIESFCTVTHVADHYQDRPLAPDSIQYQGLCMMGAPRSHRYALYTSLRHVDRSRLVMTFREAKT
jgi:hypothetical protein